MPVELLVSRSSIFASQRSPPPLSVIFHGRDGGEGGGAAAATAAGYPEPTVDPISPGLGARRCECQGLCNSPLPPLIVSGLIVTVVSFLFLLFIHRTTGCGCCCIISSFWTMWLWKMYGLIGKVDITDRSGESIRKSFFFAATSTCCPRSSAPIYWNRSTRSLARRSDLRAAVRSRNRNSRTSASSSCASNTI